LDSGRFSWRKDLQSISDLKAFGVSDAVFLNFDKYLRKFTQLFELK